MAKSLESLESLDGFRYVALADGTAERACYFGVLRNAQAFRALAKSLESLDGFRYGGNGFRY